MPKIEKEDSVKVLGSSVRSIALDKPIREPSPHKQIPAKIPARKDEVTKPKLEKPNALVSNPDLNKLISPVKKQIESTLQKLQLEAAATQGRDGPRTAVAKPLRH